MVLDEVHHCSKDHPYNQMMKLVKQQDTSSCMNPKFFGLTASPAGKSSLESTKKMLKELLDNLGENAKLISVQKETAELDRYQSNTKLSICEIKYEYDKKV